MPSKKTSTPKSSKRPAITSPSKLSSSKRPASTAPSKRPAKLLPKPVLIRRIPADKLDAADFTALATLDRVVDVTATREAVARTKQINLRAHPSHHDAWHLAADRAGLTLTAWVADRLNDAARKELKG